VIGVAWKWVPRRADVDPLTGVVTPEPRSDGPSPADEAALEVALRLGGPVTVVCAGPAGAEPMLRAARAAGATAAVRVDGLPPGASSAAVAAALGGPLRAAGADLVLCGDRSLDRGTGSVPAFLAAALGAAQALGATAVEASGDGSGRGLVVTRRLDGGRREVLRVGRPAVVSVEGGVARLRRAALPAVLEADRAAVTVVAAGTPALEAATVGAGVAPPARRGPYRPRARIRPGPPDADAHARILSLTGALVERTPPVLVHLDPERAAERILDQLRQWGYR
jgi:electron transfer flavoprotein beta subunit